MLSKREFLSRVTCSILVAERSLSFGEQAHAKSISDDWIFDGTGLPPEEKPLPQSQEIYRKNIVSKPLWLKRGADEFRIDVATLDGYKIAQWILRDVSIDKVGRPDIGLLFSLSSAQSALAALNFHSRFDFTSGLRMPQTNIKTEGAALGSLHLPDENLRFRATDFRARGFDSAFTAKLMRMAGMGGVGIYLNRDFVHADTGVKKTWVGK